MQGNEKNEVFLTVLKETVRRWLLLPDSDLAVEVLLGSVVANQLSGDPFWLFFVNPPGSAKTELIRALSGVDCIYPLSSLTPKTLISGYKDPAHPNVETSLLPQLSGKVVTMKDFTTVLTMRREDRAEILGQLREVFDGQYKKAFGTGKQIPWEGKIGLIAGVTEVIETQHATNQLLGERFFLYRIGSEDAVSVAQKALSNAGTEGNMRQELSRMCRAFFAALQLVEPELLPPVQTRLSHLATFCVSARSGAMWDNNGQILYTPGPEGPARVAKGLAQFSKGLAVVRGRVDVTTDEYAVAYRLAMDTIPKHKRHILECLQLAKEPLVAKRIEENTQLSRTTVWRRLQDLLAMQLVEKTSVAGQTGWSLSDSARQLLKEAAVD